MRRLWIVFGFFCVLFFIIALRLFYWQIMTGETLRLEAAQQYSMKMSIPARRGTLYTRDGSPIVLNQPAYLVYAKPKEISGISIFSRDVGKILGIDRQKLEERLSDPNLVWVPLAHKVEESIVKELKASKIQGLGYEEEPKRYYPEASMAAHLLGFVGSDENGRDTGYFGLEGYYDRQLRGKDGSLELEKDARGAPILARLVKRIEPENGRSLTLWLDRTIQFYVERKLKEGIQKYGALEGSVIVMDPTTGGILAMASHPSYDPTRFGEYEKEMYKNSAVASSFEPGSTFKAIVMASALSQNAVKPTTMMEETGPVQIGEYSIRTWNGQYHGPISMTQVLEYSSNVGMVFTAQSLGKEKLIDTIEAFGFGELTGIDLEDESTPSLRSRNEWKDIDIATASFGQGIAVTPLQMVRGIGALANNGWLMEPHMVKEITDSRGQKIEVKPKKIRQVISENAAHTVTEMLVSAVDRGEAKWAKPKGYRIAGKTGTAQIPVAGHYDDKKTIASFVGYAPADNPRFVMLVTLREPTSSPWGSETAAPLFFSIARDIFVYLGIPPQQ